MKTDDFKIRLDGEDGRAIRREANRQGVSCAEVIRQLIEPKLAELVRRERTAMANFVLTNCTNTLLREIADNSLHQRQIAMTYALAIRSSEETDWSKVNQAIIKRWSFGDLVQIKKMARDGTCFLNSEN